MVEAMLDLMLATQPDGTVPGREQTGGSVYQVAVHRCPDCDRTSVDTEDGPVPLTAEQAAMIACDATTEGDPDAITPEAPEGATPPWMRRRVLARDGHHCICCGARHSLMVHHLVPLEVGGVTRGFNLVCACKHCHGLAHAGFLRIEGTAPHRVRILTPEGEPLDHRTVRSRHTIRIASHGPRPGHDEPLPEELTREWVRKNKDRLHWDSGRKAFILKPRRA
jgi:hypothetical protein